jgi:hypothetical protein
MAKDTLYNINVASPVQVTREEYTNVGSVVNQVGDVKRAFLPGTDFEIWDAATGGNQLVEGNDYDLAEKDEFYSDNADFNLSGQDINAGYQITNPTFQSGSIYITYKIIASYEDADNITALRTDVDTNTSDIATISAVVPTFIEEDTTTGNTTYTLPDLATNLETSFKIMHVVQGSSNIVTIDTTGSNVISGDDLSSVELPKEGDYIEVYASSTSNKWEIVDERISCQLVLNGFTGYGTTDTAIVRLTNTVENFGNVFSENHSTGYSGGTKGIEITINKSGKYGFTLAEIPNLATSFGLSINSSQLTTDINLINQSDVRSIETLELNRVGNVSWEGYLEAGTIARFHGANQTITNTNLWHFTATYMGS